MEEHEMILKVLESASKPLSTKDIAKIVYKKFDGYRLPAFKVRNHLWDKKTLAKIVNYCKEDYTYEVHQNIEFQKKAMFNDDCVFNFNVEKVEGHKMNGDFISFEVKGDLVHIQHSIDDLSLDKVLIGLVRSEIESGPKTKSTFRKIKANIVKSVNE